MAQESRREPGEAMQFQEFYGALNEMGAVRGSAFAN